MEVSDGSSLKTTARNAGDEAFQLATRLPKAIVVVDEQRVRGARYAVEKLNAQAVVLDDGFQHRALHRDLDIVLIDAAHSPFTMAMLPAGSQAGCIEFFETGKRRASHKSKSRLQILRGLRSRSGFTQMRKFFRASFTVRAFRRAKTGFSVDLNSVKGKHAVAFCGIGQPESFKDSLEDLGMRVSSMISFEDHHPYSDSDIRRIIAEQEKWKAEYIITTEKDLARLSSLDFSEKYPALLP